LQPAREPGFEGDRVHSTADDAIRIGSTSA
jgi:hypothetical protein